MSITLLPQPTPQVGAPQPRRLLDQLRADRPRMNADQQSVAEARANRKAEARNPKQVQSLHDRKDASGALWAVRSGDSLQFSASKNASAVDEGGSRRENGCSTRRAARCTSAVRTVITRSKWLRSCRRGRSPALRAAGASGSSCNRRPPGARSRASGSGAGAAAIPPWPR